MVHEINVKVDLLIFKYLRLIIRINFMLMVNDYAPANLWNIRNQSPTVYVHLNYSYAYNVAYMYEEFYQFVPYRKHSASPF
jgi:hypothetical protein